MAKLFSEARYTEIVPSVLKHKFCMIFLVEDLRNAPKHYQTSFSVKMVRLDVFVAKLFPEVQYPGIVHLASKHNFCMNFCADGLRNAIKHSQRSFWV